MKDAVNQYMEELTPQQMKKVKRLLESLERDFGFTLVKNRVVREGWVLQLGTVILVDYNDFTIRCINHPTKLIPTRDMIFSTLHPIDFLTRVTMNKINSEYLIFKELIE